jgi:putative transposase
MLKVHKIALDPNDRQRTHLARCAGVARFAYMARQYEAHKADPARRAPPVFCGETPDEW